MFNNLQLLKGSIGKIVNTSNISNISGKFPKSFLESFRQTKFMEVLQPYRPVDNSDLAIRRPSAP